MVTLETSELLPRRQYSVYSYETRRIYMLWFIPAQFSWFGSALVHLHISVALLGMLKLRKIAVGQVSTGLYQGKGGLSSSMGWGDRLVAIRRSGG